MRIGSRIFEPRLFTSLLTIALLALLVSLGRWQLRRAAEKQTLFDSFAAGAEAPLPIEAATPPVPRYRRVEARGHYDSSRQVLIDNMVSRERAGYYVITPFALAGGGWVWINRGWLPLGQSRAQIPNVAVNEDMRSVSGRADHLPAAGIQLGKRPVLSAPFPVVAAFPNAAELARLLPDNTWTSATETILLDPALPDGYVRAWAPPGFPPLRHIGYAVQWFGLALALAVIYIVTNLRRAPEARP